MHRRAGTHVTPIPERVARSVGVLALLLAVAVSLWPSAEGDAARLVVMRLDHVEMSADSVVQRLRVGITQWAANGQVRLSTPPGAGGTFTDWPTASLIATVVPPADIRDVLAATRDAGLPVVWTDSTMVRDVAIDAGRAPSPGAAALLAASGRTADSASTLVLRDAGGTLDSVTSRRPTVRVLAAQTRGSVQAMLRASSANARERAKRGEQTRVRVVATAAALATDTAGAADRSTVGRVRLYALPGWESKFVTVALEEAGWHVDGALTVSPTSQVTLGAPLMLDTARYAVSVVLDSGVVSARDLQRFVAQGGGILLAGDALRDASLRAFAALRIEDERPPVAGALLTDQPLRGLAAFHVLPPAQSVVLQRENADATVIVARRGVGRILASGYRATWRWRMEGTDDGADAHRRWWNTLVSAVASAPAVNAKSPDASRTEASRSEASPTEALTAAWPGDAAPRADLIARLGLPVSASAAAPRSSSSLRPPLAWLYLVACGALLTEWALRRVRGAR